MNRKKVLQEKIVREKALTFDDVLLLPNYTDFKRQEVDLTTKLHKKILLKLPVISAPMDTVTEERMATELALMGGLGIIHRNLSIEAQALMVKNVKKKKLMVGAAVGPGIDLQERVEALHKIGTDVIVVDSAHGFSKFVIDAVAYIKKTFPSSVVMAGNIAIYEGAKALIKVGTDILRVGMGPGSICTTRIISGMGVPQITAITEAVKAVDKTGVTVVADGGIRQIGDMAKAFAFGASAVMLGSLLAQFDESPGEQIVIQGKKYKQYRGMGSIAAMKKGGAERYGQSRNTDEKKLIPEGIEGMVEYKGKVADYLYQIQGSLKSSFYYIGAKTMEEFFKKSKCIRISNAGLLESHPHDVTISNPGDNYTV
ncbi:guanosine monophosphate reductase [Candidatus Roizmanbacteria bacterium CG09_land_8_20_14_0_10_41_9]|uniref:Guanosine monophosphate reductase n=1 Tax=Candidatus Roizmanbacteria bacterium CG09_land_8_20_14_0_10_41_9 TaxID=1974850 RepID=A0A2H0WSU7_9BACT|nr:MAG: guanosine monophosphate reductase [Candidatus Roizmanbacteria bacterium CG09_land_8_20_14_0_10_41_9]